MEVLLSVYSVIAWKVLELRELARGDAHCSPDVLLSETERSILETKFPELTDSEPQAYAIAVAKIGGYLDRGSDPPPRLGDDVERPQESSDLGGGIRTALLKLMGKRQG